MPATGSDGIGLRIARELGHDLVDTYPALTPLLAESDRHAALSGVSLTVRLRSKDAGKPIETHGGFLFTHRGYSGPSVLDISHVTARGTTPPIRVQWAAIDRWTTSSSERGRFGRRRSSRVTCRAGSPNN